MVLTQPGQSAVQRLLMHWKYWINLEADCDPSEKCLEIKLAAEVSDLSGDMYQVLVQGTDRIITRLAQAVCGFHDTWTLSPRSFGHSFHAHLDRQSERSDAGSHC